MTIDEALAIQLLARLAECSTLHDAHERSRGIACGVIDELQPLRLRGRGAGFQTHELAPRANESFSVRARSYACANPGPGERVTGLAPWPFPGA